MYSAECLKDMESYGMTTPNVLKRMLITCQDPIETIKKFQAENGIQLDILNPALKLLDLHGIRRAELHEAVASELAKKTIQKIRSLGEQRTPQNIAALGRQLDRCFKLYRLPKLRPIVLETLRQLPIIPNRYLQLIVCDAELYRSCDVGVRRQIWAKNSELFADYVSAVIDAYMEAKDRLLLSVDKLPTNFFTCDTTRTRRQWPQIRELMNMIGNEEVLYTQLITEIRRRFATAPNYHLCALRAEILMATHEASVEYAIHVDPCHDFAWCLDTCIRGKHWDAQQTTKLRNLLDASRKEYGKPGDLADMAMIVRDPHAVHFLASMAVKIVRDGVNAAGGHLPREHQALHLILRLLYLGASATKLLHDNTLLSLATVVDCVTQFLPSFAYLMAENVLRFELQRAPDEIADEFYSELLVDESTMEQLADHLRSDEVCALLWLHYLLDVMPSKRRFLQRAALYRYIQYLPILANGIGSTDPWIHLFLHRLIQTNVIDSIIADDRIGRRIIHSMMIDDLKVQPSAKFHLLRLCLHLRAHIGDDLMREANDALVKLYEQLQGPRNALTDGDEASGNQPATKLDEFFLQELEKYRNVVPGVAFTTVTTTAGSTDFSTYSSLSAEAVAAASLDD